MKEETKVRIESEMEFHFAERPFEPGMFPYKQR